VADRTNELIQKDTEKYFKDIFPGLEKVRWGIGFLRCGILLFDKLIDQELNNKQEAEELHTAAANGFGAAYKFLMAKSPAKAAVVLQLMLHCLDSKSPSK